MILEILIGFVTAWIVLWLFYYYLKWAASYRNNLKFSFGSTDSDYKKNLLPHASVSDSAKYIYFWYNFYLLKYTS